MKEQNKSLQKSYSTTKALHDVSVKDGPVTFDNVRLGECDKERFTWWRMEQDAHHLSRALCGAFCSILHHVKRFMSQPP